MNAWFEQFIVSVWSMKITWNMKSVVLYGAMRYHDAEHGPDMYGAELWFLHKLAMHRSVTE